MVQTSIAVIAVCVVILVFALRSSYHTVPEGDVEILLVFGDEREVLEPGPYFVPPFVSATYPIDLQTMKYETSRGQRAVPPNSELNSRPSLQTDRVLRNDNSSAILTVLSVAAVLGTLSVADAR